MGQVSAGFGVNAPQPLFVLRGADMQSTADQVFTKLGSFTNYVVSEVVAKRKSGGASVACLGGIYNAAAKGGDALIAAAQSWVALTVAGKIVKATLAAVLGSDLQTATPILSLSTGSTAAATADVFIYGYVVD